MQKEYRIAGRYHPAENNRRLSADKIATSEYIEERDVSELKRSPAEDEILVQLRHLRSLNKSALQSKIGVEILSSSEKILIRFLCAISAIILHVVTGRICSKGQINKILRMLFGKEEWLLVTDMGLKLILNELLPETGTALVRDLSVWLAVTKMDPERSQNVWRAAKITVPVNLQK